jgi:hypothetical protein
MCRRSRHVAEQANELVRRSGGARPPRPRASAGRPNYGEDFARHDAPHSPDRSRRKLHHPVYARGPSPEGDLEPRGRPARGRNARRPGGDLRGEPRLRASLAAAPVGTRPRGSARRSRRAERRRVSYGGRDRRSVARGDERVRGHRIDPRRHDAGGSAAASRRDGCRRDASARSGAHAGASCGRGARGTNRGRRAGRDACGELTRKPTVRSVRSCPRWPTRRGREGGRLLCDRAGSLAPGTVRGGAP